MSGGSKQQQVSSTNSAPWAAAQPALQLGLNRATDLFNQGVGSQPYTGSTVVPFASQTMQGMHGGQHRAHSWQGAFDRNFERLSDQAADGGLNQLQRDQIGRLDQFARSNPENGYEALNNVQKGVLGRWEKMAFGGEMNGNPHLDDVISRASRDMQDSINLSASGMGRYGSGVHQGVLAEEIGDMSSGLRFNDYNNQLSRMDNAIQGLAGLGNQANAQYESAMGRKFDAMGSLYNAGQQQRQNNLNSTQGLLAAYQAGQAPGQTLMDIGGMYEDLYGRQLNDQLRIFNQQQNAPWEMIGRLQGVAQGAGTMGGTQQNFAQQPGRFQQALGGALGGFGATGSPWGALLGGGLGLFG